MVCGWESCNSPNKTDFLGFSSNKRSRSPGSSVARPETPATQANPEGRFLLFRSVTCNFDLIFWSKKPKFGEN
jgi:hypothetical protein